ncbi:phospholipid hydroperoxide glutathione peroxidase-like [Sipha flava]|uniref:Phospholipid hydroperoxide glutathione peroxidase-like n=1 Tax=Sipha flava TaxID=143950 RepID=A0A8B8FKC0_9HEMI|nr:phospholipid hydroperoxide glutathione peroxidase-like [Sipha flava]
MSPKGILCVLALVTILPLVLSYDFFITEGIRNYKFRYSAENVYKFNVTEIDGKISSMNQYKNKTLIILNLPFSLEARRIYVLGLLFLKHYNKGLRIIGFPTDELTPGSHADDKYNSPVFMRNYIRENQIKFQVYHKTLVNGPLAHPLWSYMKATFSLFDNCITNNYTMFIVDKRGIPVQRLPEDERPFFEEIEDAVVPYLYFQ